MAEVNKVTSLEVARLAGVSQSAVRDRKSVV